jgi:glucose/arabinose dehydrogenase
MRAPSLSACLSALALATPAAAQAPATYQPADGLRVEVVATGLSSPDFVTAPPGDARLFVLEQPGVIRIVRAGRLLPAPFLDLRAIVRSGGERGLLGMAFHPDYARRGTFFVNYTDRDGNTRVVRYRVSRDPDRADPASAVALLRIEQPYANHNGGMLAFGPDSMLYVGMGDGGSGGDPHGNGQNLGTLLGKLLRIDVDRGRPYAIPPDNPFVGVAGARGEIWASGLRNPWRFAFDRAAPRLYIADVGQNEWEEIDVADARTGGINYGWNLREGLHAFRDGRAAGRAPTDPLLEYSHVDGCSVTGGYVYRGAAWPELRGTYFFSDWCSGWLRSFRWRDGRATELREWRVGKLGQVTSFGEDGSGELLLTTSQGRLLRLVRGR